MAKAKAKTKKITTAAIMKAIAYEDKQIVITCGTGEDTIEIPVKARLSLPERIAMVDDIVDMVFIADENGEVSYYPALKKFAIEYAIVNYFTDVALPADSDKAWEFLEKTSFANKIACALRDDYIVEILTEANDAIECRKQALLKRSKLDTVLDSVVDVIQAVGDKTENIELPQLLEYVQKNAPELKGELEKMIKTEAVAAPTA